MLESISDDPLFKVCNRKENCVHPDGPHLPLDQFYRSEKGKAGRRPRCKACEAADHQAYAKAHPEKLQALSRKWYATHAKQQRERKREYFAANADKVRAGNRRWYAAHRQQRSDYNRQWKQANRDKARAIEHRREARKRALAAQLTPAQWLWLLEQSGYRCVYCGQHEAECGTLQQDHVVPIKQGGAWTVTNIVPACRSCNSSKKGRTPQQVGMVMVIEINPLKYMEQLPLFDQEDGK